MELEPITHLEKSIAGTVAPVTHLEKVIEQYGGGGGGGAVSSVNGKTGAVVLNAEDVGGAQESLKLTATPTAGPNGNILMSGTWSGATWEQVVAAVLASRLIQIDFAGLGPVTLLYNAVSPTSADSVCCAFKSEGTVVIARITLYSNSNFTAIIIARADPDVVTIGESVVSFEPQANTIYKCGEMTSLTISNPPASGAYSIVFTSGSTATTTTFPAAILGLEDFAAEANTIYEINVLDNRAVYNGWGVR